MNQLDQAYQHIRIAIESAQDIMQNWILLALLRVFSFASCNLLIGELSSKGVESMNYYCSGSLVFSIAYFLYQKEWTKLNLTSRGLLDTDAKQE